jgi:hypothetical protein
MLGATRLDVILGGSDWLDDSRESSPVYVEVEGGKCKWVVLCPPAASLICPVKASLTAYSAARVRGFYCSSRPVFLVEGVVFYLTLLITGLSVVCSERVTCKFLIVVA